MPAHSRTNTSDENDDNNNKTGKKRKERDRERGELTAVRYLDYNCMYSTQS